MKSARRLTIPPTWRQQGLIFGPLMSRRLGHSLGIINVPRKVCSYSCVYCQAGLTERTQVERRALYDPALLAKSVRERVERVRKLGEPVDHLTFVPDGEPTLDLHLGRTIELLRPLRVPIAVLSNGSLLWRPDVRHDLALADWVSIKVDSVDEAVWRAHNRPDDSLSLHQVLDGMQRFAADARGALVTETMLVQGSNDTLGELEATADFVATLSPTTAYLSLPVRPPCEPWVEPPDVHWVEYACEVFGQRVGRVELLGEHDARLAAKCGQRIESRNARGAPFDDATSSDKRTAHDRATQHRRQHDGS